MRIGTRRSALALAQARLVCDRVEIGQHVECEIVPITTRGDRGEAVEDKSRWVAELEQALLDGRIDLAVHSAKDVPGELAEGLSLLGAPSRAAPGDVICGAWGLDALEEGARVGTSSIRRVAQLRAAR
jgi:hydroxymethylbilane synthase